MTGRQRKWGYLLRSKPFEFHWSICTGKTGQNRRLRQGGLKGALEGKQKYRPWSQSTLPFSLALTLRAKEHLYRYIIRASPACTHRLAHRGKMVARETLKNSPITSRHVTHVSLCTKHIAAAQAGMFQLQQTQTTACYCCCSCECMIWAKINSRQ